MMSISNFRRRQDTPPRPRREGRRKQPKYSTSFLVVSSIVVIILICQSILIPTLLLEFHQLDSNIDNSNHHRPDFLTTSSFKNNNNTNDNNDKPKGRFNSVEKKKNVSVLSASNNNNQTLTVINNSNNENVPPIYSSWLHYYDHGKDHGEGKGTKQTQQSGRRRIPPLISILEEPTAKIIRVHNSWNDLTRYVCGNVAIPPNSSVTIDLSTKEESGCFIMKMGVGDSNTSDSIPILLSSVYPYYGMLSKQPPTTVRFEPSKKESNATPIDDGDCDIPCWIQPVRPGTIQFKGRIDNLPPSMIFDPISMEGAGYFKTFQINYDKWKYNKYYATTSFDSDIILSYFLPFDTKLQSHPVNYNEALPRASFLAKNCESANSRERVIRLMINYHHTNPSKGIQIDSLSNCLANANFPIGIDRKNKTQILRQYLFHLAFENQRYPDYISEKLWHVLESGTLPVYWGPPNIRDHLPSDNSVILYDDFNNDPIALSKYLQKVASNQTLYESYHEWRKQKQPLRREFKEKYNFTYTHATCRFCRWGYSKKYGLGWSQPKQQLIPLNIDRKTCISKTTGLIVRPFHEIRVLESNASNGDGSETMDHEHDDVLDCAYDTSNDDEDVEQLPFYRITNYNGWKRIVYDHDGVTDMRFVLENMTNSTTLINNEDNSKDASTANEIRLITPILSKNLYTPPDIDDEVQYWLQDDRSRITILLSEPLKVELKQRRQQQKTELLIYLPSNLKSQETLKPSSGMQQMVVDLRMIVEDLDLFHKDATNYESYFGATMARDFFEPLDIKRIQH